MTENVSLKMCPSGSNRLGPKLETRQGVTLSDPLTLAKPQVRHTEGHIGSHFVIYTQRAHTQDDLWLKNPTLCGAGR